MKCQLKVFCIAFLSLCSINRDGNAQKIHQADKKTYKFEQNEYKFKELDAIMSRNEEAHIYYSKALKNQKNSAAFGFLTLTSTIASFVLIEQANNCTGYLCGIGEGVGALGAIGVGTLSLIGFAINIDRATKNRKKSLEIFNSAMSPRNPYQTLTMNLVVYPGGIRIILEF